MTIDQIKKLTVNIPSHVTQKEGMLLYGLAKNCSGRGVIVEIGSWKGRSTVWLGKGSEAGRGIKVYAVDPHQGEALRKEGDSGVPTIEVFNENIKKAQLESIVRPMVMTSSEAVKQITEPVELIFIDGDHSHEGVKKDFNIWFPRVVDGGILAFHDTNGRPGPTHLVNKEVHRSKYFKNIKLVDSITYAQKVSNNKFADKVINSLVLYRKNIFVLLPKYLKWRFLGLAVSIRKILFRR